MVRLSVLLAVLQIVDDITSFYLETYTNYSKGDERLKETLRVIQTGVSHLCLDQRVAQYESTL